MLVKHDVTGFDVAVNHALAVGVVQGTADLFQQVGHFFQRYRIALEVAQPITEGATCEQAHGHITDLVGCAVVKHGHDVGVFQRCRELGFLGKALHVLRVVLDGQ